MWSGVGLGLWRKILIAVRDRVAVKSRVSPEDPLLAPGAVQRGIPRDHHVEFKMPDVG